MKLVGYVRVSTDRQAEQGLGLQEQERIIRRWTRSQGHRLAGVFVDSGQSGANGLDSRVGLGEALAALRTGLAQGLVVYRLDRLARDVVLQETLLREIWGYECQLYSTSESEADYLVDDPEDPSRKLIRQILGAIADYERGMIRLRLMSGRRAKARRGGYAFGAPPFGYAAANKRLVPDSREQEALKLMATLREQGFSLPQICSELEQAGFQPRRGRRWYPTSVSRCLSRAASGA